MISVLRRFRRDEKGTVTVDWVVLTAAVVGLSAGAYNAIAEGTATLAADIQKAIEDDL